MPRVIFTERALQDLKRLRDFLKSKAPEAAKRAGLTIQAADGRARLAAHRPAGA